MLHPSSKGYFLAYRRAPNATLSMAEKQQIYQFREEHPKCSFNDIARIFSARFGKNISKQRCHQIMKHLKGKTVMPEELSRKRFSGGKTQHSVQALQQKQDHS